MQQYRFTEWEQRKREQLECSSIVKHFSSICCIIGSITRGGKKKRKTNKEATKEKPGYQPSHKSLHL